MLTRALDAYRSWKEFGSGGRSAFDIGGERARLRLDGIVQSGLSVVGQSDSDEDAYWTKSITVPANLFFKGVGERMEALCTRLERRCARVR